MDIPTTNEKREPASGRIPFYVRDGVRIGHRALPGRNPEVIGLSDAPSHDTPGDSGRTGRPRSGPRSLGKRRAQRPGL